VHYPNQGLAVLSPNFEVFLPEPSGPMVYLENRI
jgi:hypothetical protein